MEPWLLLLSSIGMAWITLEMARWLASLQKLKQEDLEKLAGIDRQSTDATGPSIIIKSLTFVFLLLAISGVITVSLVIVTIKAFSGAL